MKIIISERQQKLLNESKSLESAQNLIDDAIEVLKNECEEKWVDPLACDQWETIEEVKVVSSNKGSAITRNQKTNFWLIDVDIYYSSLGHTPFDDFIYDGFLRRNLWIRIKERFEKETLSSFENNKVDFKIHPSSNLSMQLPDDFDVMNSEPFIKGWIEIQDLSSQQLGSAYAPKPNQKWLDACAASGGKSLQLLDMQSSIDLTVTDIRESILTNLQLRFKRNHIRNYKSKVVDWNDTISAVSRSESEMYDAIIADVPCSGSGTWARTPEQKLSITKEMIQNFSELQFSITNNLSAVLRKGGALYYSTCSVYKNENIDVVNRLVNNQSLELVDQKVISGIDSHADTMYLAKLIKN